MIWCVVWVVLFVFGYENWVIGCVFDFVYCFDGLVVYELVSFWVCVVDWIDIVF